jgi:hypothetical protein
MPVLSKPPRRDQRSKSLFVLALLIAGCAAPQLVRCPIADADLTKRIFEIAPKGTPRDETIAKLRAAGLAGSFGGEKSAFGKDYFCCQTWRQPDGEVWRINLLLHFDKAGNFVDTLDLPDLNTTGLKPAKSAS